MSVNDASPIAPEHLWWCPDEARYVAWRGHDDAVAEARVAVVSLAGQRRDAPRAALEPVAIEVAAATLEPLAKETLRRIGERLGQLDPAFARDWQPASNVAGLDVNAAARRLVETLRAAPDASQAAVEAVLVDVYALVALCDFGPAARLVIERLGAAEGAPPPEEDAAMRARVRADVRAELDRHDADRAPRSFDFDFATLRRPAAQPEPPVPPVQTAQPLETAPPVIVRRVTAADVPEVIALVSEVLAEHGLAFGDGSATDDQLRHLPAIYDDAGGAFWVAHLDGVLVGTCGVFPIAPATLELRKMYLAVAARGLGVGARLLEVAVAFARGHGARAIVLDTTDQMGRAIAFYERHGFVRDDAQIRGARCSRGYRLDL